MQTLNTARTSHRFWLQSAAALSVAAGIFHMVAAPAYFQVWVGYGLFFALAVAAQWMYATMLWHHLSLWGDRPKPAWLWPGLIGNALIIGLWLLTRTAGIPFFGPQAWQVQPVGQLDLLAVIAELIVIGGLASLLPEHQAETPPQRLTGRVAR